MDPKNIEEKDFIGLEPVTFPLERHWIYAFIYNDDKKYGTQLMRLRKSVFDFMYSTTSLNYFYMISKSSVIQRYKELYLKNDFHKKISNMLISYQNNRIYKPFYRQAKETYTNLKYYLGYLWEEKEKYMEPLNLKQFILHLEYMDRISNTLYLRDNFIMIKTNDMDHNEPNNKYLIEYVGCLYEAYVGLKYINEAKRYIPNFLYTYSYSECSKPFISNENKLLSWCNKTGTEKNLYPYVTKEFPLNSIKLIDFLNQSNPEDIVKLNHIIIQYRNALVVAKGVSGNFKLSTVNLSNLRVLNLDMPIDIPIYEYRESLLKSAQNLIPIKSLKTNIILYIDDLSGGECFEISYNKYGTNYVYDNDLFIMIKDYLKKINKNWDEFDSTKYDSPMYYKTNQKVEFDDIVQLKLDGNIYQKALNYCNVNHKDKFIERDFKKHLHHQMKSLDDILNRISIVSTYDLMTICERYILLLTVLSGTLCIKDKSFLVKNFEIKSKIMDIIEKNFISLDEDLRNDYLYTIKELSRNIPDISFFINIFGDFNLSNIIATFFAVGLIIFLIVFLKSNPNFIETINSAAAFKEYLDSLAYYQEAIEFAIFPAKFVYEVGGLTGVGIISTAMVIQAMYNFITQSTETLWIITLTNSILFTFTERLIRVFLSYNVLFWKIMIKFIGWAISLTQNAVYYSFGSIKYLSWFFLTTFINDVKFNKMLGDFYTLTVKDFKQAITRRLYVSPVDEILLNNPDSSKVEKIKADIDNLLDGVMKIAPKITLNGPNIQQSFMVDN